MPYLDSVRLPRRSLLRSSLLLLGGLFVPASLLASGERRHRVVRGDNLTRIARTYGVTVADLRRANGLRSDTIRIGQVLIVPGPPATGRIFPALVPVVEATARINVDRPRWRWIVGHHSGVNTGSARVYDRYHRERRRMANGLAYHFVIGNGTGSRDGQIEIGRRWTEQLAGGHVRRDEVNEHGIGICLVGNFESDRPSPAQLASFEALVGWLQGDLLGRRPAFAVHREIDRNHTVCPGRNFPVREMHRKFPSRA